MELVARKTGEDSLYRGDQGSKEKDAHQEEHRSLSVDIDHFQIVELKKFLPKKDRRH